MRFEDWMRLVNPQVGSFSQSVATNRREEEERFDHGGFD
jgi:hypothetical protein